MNRVNLLKLTNRHSILKVFRSFFCSRILTDRNENKSKNVKNKIQFHSEEKKQVKPSLRGKQVEKFLKIICTARKEKRVYTFCVRVFRDDDEDPPQKRTEERKECLLFFPMSYFPNVHRLDEDYNTLGQLKLPFWR